MAERGGQEGNNNAGKNKPWTDAVRRALLANDGQKLRKLADKLIATAMRGNVNALKEIGDRVEGKVPQAITGADGGPIQVQEIPWLKGRGLARS